MSGRLPRTTAELAAHEKLKADNRMDVYESAKAKALADGYKFEHACILAHEARMAAWRDDRAAEARKEAAADAARPPQSSGWLTRMFGGGK